MAWSGRARFSRAAPWVLVLLLCLGWNALEMFQRQRVFGTAWLGGWDDNLYFAWGRSLAVDGDWDFSNDVTFPASLVAFGEDAGAFRAYLSRGERTQTGRVPNKYACGAGMLALPLLLPTRLVLDLLAFAGFTTQSDPFSSLYVFAFIASGVLWGFVGLVAALALLRRDYSRGVAGLAVLAGAIGFPLGFYIWFAPTMAHAVGFGVATLYVLCGRMWADRVTTTPEHAMAWRLAAFLMGLALGIACLVRFTNIVLVLVPIVMAWTLRSSAHFDARSWPAVMVQSLGLAAVGSVIGFLPQLIAWKIVYGAFVVDSYSGETLAGWPNHLLFVLFGPRNGLFSWTPLAMVAVAGLVLGVRRSPMCRAGLVVLAATAWIYGGWQMYWLGHSFGMRGFVDVSFFLMLGLAEGIRRAQCLPAYHRLRRAGHVLLVLLLVWNLHLIICYRAQIQPHGERLALRPILTEWRRWGQQVYTDSGIRLLVRRTRAKASSAAQ